MKIVIYTIAFGEKFGIANQPKFEGVDYICFSDIERKSKTWKVIKVDRKFEDPTRDSRHYKMLPHLYLSDYDVSIFIDANFLVTCDIKDFVKNVFKNEIFMGFDHNYVTGDERDCVYDEYDHIIKLGQRKQRYKDVPEVMKKQLDRYREEGYPANNGLIVTSVLIRRHNDPVVIKLMNEWWEEISNGSKRDQLSFDYVCWKNKFTYSCLPGDIRLGNPWFRTLGSNRKNFTKKIIEYKIKKILGKA